MSSDQATTRGRKPWYRARNIILLVLLALAIVIGQSVYRATVAQPGAPVDYAQRVYDAVVRAQPGDGDDGWPHLLDAIAVLDELEEELRQEYGREPPEWWPVNYGWPTDYTILRDATADPDARAFVARQMEQLRQRGLHEHLAMLAASPRAIRPKFPEGRLIDVLLPELGRGRQLARYSASRMYIASRQNDPDEVVAAFEQMLALGRVFKSQAMLIERLVGVAIISLTMMEVKYQLSDGVIDSGTARRLLQAMDRQLDNNPPLALQIEGERLAIMDMIQRTYSDDGRGDGRLLLSRAATYGDVSGDTMPVPSSRVLNVLGVFFPSRKEITAKTDEWCGKWADLSRLPWRLAAPGAGELDAAVESLPRGYFLLKLMLPALAKSLQSESQGRMDIIGTRIMLALEIHKAEHGSYPQRLEELVPGLLKEVPMDPVSGRAYVYRLLSAEERTLGPWEYLLYSRGADGEDDGGVEDATSKYNAMRPGASGTDFIVNEPRPGQ